MSINLVGNIYDIAMLFVNVSLGMNLSQQNIFNSEYCVNFNVVFVVQLQSEIGVR